MHITCHSCGQTIPAANLDVPTAIAKCDGCNALFSFRDALETPPAPLQRELVGLPERFAVEDHGGALSISWSWRKSGSIVILLFLVPWFLILIAWNWIALSQGAWQLSFFSLFHVAAGVFVAVVGLRQWFNTTVITVDRTRLKVAVGPVPAPGRMEVPSSSLDQLFCVAREHSGKNGRRWKTYNVVAKTKDGREQTIIANLETDRQALFIEQKLERHLSIENRPMPGELIR